MLNPWPKITDIHYVKDILEKKRLGAETVSIILAILWLFFITFLHHFISSNYSGARFRIGFLPITCHLILPVALERDTALRRIIQPVKLSSWPDMIEALKGGELDAAFILAPIALYLMDQGVPMKIALLGHRNGTCLVVSKGSSIESALDLKGKTVAIPIRFSTQNLALLRYLKAGGVGESEVEILELAPPDMPAALASGSIDAYIVGEPYAAQAELSGTGRVMHDIQDIWPDFISSLLVVREDMLNRDRGKTNGIIRSFYSTAAWIENNREEAAVIGARFFGLPAVLLRHVLVHVPARVSYVDIIPEREELEHIGQLMTGFGLVKRPPSFQIYRGWQ